MNYARPELLDPLAGEYVLGHLRGRARERFERLLLSDVAVAQTVTDWQERLAPLARLAPPVVPRPRVWREIRRRIAPARSRRRPWFSARAAAVAASAAFLAILGLYLARPAVTPAPAGQQLALLTSHQGTPRWLISVRGRHLKMLTVGAGATPPQGKSYQLWMLPGGGAKPISLGLLPSSGLASEVLSPRQVQALKGARGLAVSVEPHGGSPTGLPTGPVVYTGSFISG